MRQSLAGVGELCRRHGTLLLVDGVASIGGVPLLADAWQIDALYTGKRLPACMSSAAWARLGWGACSSTCLRVRVEHSHAHWPGRPRPGCVAGSQKCLAAPPGAAPLMLNERALAKVQGRKSKVQSYYFDLTLVGDYW